MKTVVCIPAFNEEKTLGKVIDEIKKVMGKKEFTVLVLDDGSSDKTSEVARRRGAHVVRHKRNLGLAETFKDEMEAAVRLGADIIVHTDADGQYPARYIPKMIRMVEAGYDLVLGSRFGGGHYSGSLGKRLGNIAFAKVFSGLLDTRITDTTTGFRAFTREVAKIPMINTFTYTQEQILRAGRMKMKVGEISITTRKTRPSRLFSSPLNYALRSWVNILRIYRDFEPLRFFGRVGLSFVAAGVLLGGYITYLVIATGNAGGIPRVILSMLLIVTGIQILLFGFLADMLKR